MDLFWQDYTRKILDKLKDYREQYRRSKRDALSALIRYISHNEEPMCYDVFRAQGYCIGSEAAEGACKHVVGKRFEAIWHDLDTAGIYGGSGLPRNVSK